MALEGSVLPIPNILHRHVGGSELTPAEDGLEYAPALLNQATHQMPDTISEDDEKKDIDEKVEPAHLVSVQDYDLSAKPYVPGDPLPEPADQRPEDLSDQITFRAIFVGICIGTLVTGSNTYLGLKTGFTFLPALLGGIGGFLVLKPLSRVIPMWLPKWFGTGEFGPKENVCCQSAATATGGLAALWVAGFPAMYQLGLLSAKPQDDFGKLIAFTATVAFYGMAFAIPLRKFYILRQKLVFPTPTATGYAIRALHNGAHGAADAAAKAKWMGFSFLAAFVQKVASTWAPGILYDWHFFYWIADWGGRSAQYVDNWGWLFEWTPAFFGAGMLSGINASYSFYGGSILAWAIIGPSMVATGRAVGVSTVEDDDTSGIPYISYYSMKCKNPTSTNCSPRYNLLWAGVLIMLVSAFVELFVQWRVFGRALTPTVYNVRNYFRSRKGEEKLHHESMDELVDPAAPNEQVPLWMWLGSLVLAIVLSISILNTIFNINVGLIILALVFAFIFSVMGVLGAATTDINPITACAKASQLVIGGATHGWYANDVVPATDILPAINPTLLSVNLLSGMVAAGAADQTVNMTGDLKTGHLLRAAPVAQFVAQFCGAAASIVIGAAFFCLFTTAAPCIIDLSAETCQYAVPSVSAWRAVALAVTSDSLPVPVTAGIIALVLAAASAGLIVARETIVPHKYRCYVPNPAAAGLAFVLPATTYGAAMVVGSTGAYFWNRKNPSHFERVGYAMAAGLISGEGMGGVAQAIIIIAGGAGASVVSTAGCPNGGC